MMPILFLWQGSGSSPTPPPAIVVDGAMRRRIRHPEKVRLRDDVIREERMVAEYVEQLERNQKRLARAPARERKKATRETPVPRLTDAMARAASAQQLMAVIRSASAAELDRQRAVEEEHRRRRTLLILLALD